MCGIAGWINVENKIEKKVFQSMVATLYHRGPDDKGTYFNQAENIALGHTRLSFLDLSKSGKQPMSNNDASVHITFNGEIYNYIELREQLKPHYTFKTNTDTEVILAAYHHWGNDFMQHLRGMFALAILDEHQQKLLLVRDRFGIKPLYYFVGEKDFIFASELKAIMASELPERKIDYTSFADFFVYRYIPSPKTIWQGISKLPAAHYLELNTTNLSFTITEYWKPTFNNNESNENDLIKEINILLQESVKEHIRADVPIGSFLSGGYDSSAMVHYMKQLGENPDTFSIGFANWPQSEHYYAKIVANHLNVPNESVIADQSSLEYIDLMPEVYDEPIADISIIPTYMVSQLARKKVKAVLSGEGADELFGGYTWQKEFYSLNNPDTLKDKIVLFFNKPDVVDYYANAMAMGLFDKNELTKMLPPDLHQYIHEDVNWYYRKHYQKRLSPLKTIQYLDMKCFMGELVLTKIDRASMANSLEVRVPFLDHRIFEKVFSLKEENYYRKSSTKFLLYENLKNHIPKEILERKKQGFVGPDNYYMNIDWYKEILKDAQLVKLGLVKKEYIDNLLNETYNWKLWKLAVMEKWVRKWLN